MNENEYPEWWPSLPPIYDITKSYKENFELGPFIKEDAYPSRKLPPKQKWKELCGMKIASPIGVPAGPLLNSRWIEAASRLGFDVVTYKTIRSKEHPGHPLPNMLFVDTPSMLSDTSSPIYVAKTSPKNVSSIAVTNSFGMPSRDREFLKEDIPRANSLLREGQVMIVSVVGTPSSSTCGSSPTTTPQDSYTEFVRDFVDTALFAKNCGAQIIEANFSCPNVATGEGSIFQNAGLVASISSALVGALGNTPLIIKVGTFQDIELMKSVFKEAAKAKVSAICGINSVSMRVLNQETKNAALGEGRELSGVCGGPIKEMALQFTKSAVDIIKREQLNLSLLSCGGITDASHFDEFLNVGANVAMTATGMIFDPYLAARYHHKKSVNEL